MRLIDADKLADFVCSVCGGGCDVQHRGDCIERDFTEQCAKEMPTVDAVEVVRCKDCKYGKRLIDVNGLHYLVCGNPFGHGIMVGNHNFCSWGERREDADT